MVSRDQPLIFFRPEWHFFRGYVHGFSTPTVSGNLTVTESADFNSAELIRLLTEVTGLLELEGHRVDYASNLLVEKDFGVVELMLDVGGELLRLNKVPAIGRPKIVRQHSTEPQRIPIRFFFPCFQPKAVMAVLQWLARFVLFAHSKSYRFHDAELVDLKNSYARLEKSFKGFALQGINNMHFLEAAVEERIQIQMLDTNRTFVYGTGSRRRIVQSGFTDETSYLAAMFAQSKHVTSGLLRAHGIPVPKQIAVKTEAQAIEAAEKIGFPAVVKPNACDGGRGVYAGLKTKEAVAHAFRDAVKHCSDVLIEECVGGQDYRVTVLHGKAVKIIHRRAGGVIGDGRQTILSLVDQIKQSVDMRRNFRHSGRHFLDLDDEARGLLAEQGLSEDSILNPGQFLPLRRKSNISSGGVQSVIDLALAHPDNLLLVERATQCIGLDLGGVDLLIDDISKSWLDIGAHIIEINSAPQISNINTPDIYRQILLALMPSKEPIPVHYIVLGADQPAPGLVAIQELAAERGCNAHVSLHGAFVRGRRYSGQQRSCFEAARGLLLSQEVESLLVLISEDEILESGLPSATYASIQHHDIPDSQKPNSIVLSLINTTMHFPVVHIDTKRQS